MKTALFIVAFVMLAGFAILGNAPAQVASPPVTKWEYKMVEGDLDVAGLNKLGDEGWELAAAISNVSGGSAFPSGSSGGRTSGVAPGGMPSLGGPITSLRTSIKLTFKRSKR